MAYHDYDDWTDFLLGDPDLPPSWEWSLWDRFRSDFDPLIGAARDKPGVRSGQSPPGRKGGVEFGRMGWKESDHRKWPHGPPANPVGSRSRKFLDVEVWAPSWNQCGRDGRPPDVFLSALNTALNPAGRKIPFNPVIILAIDVSLARREAPLVPASVASLRRLTSPKLVGYKRRMWGEPFGSIGFTNSIEDLRVGGPFKSGHGHADEVGFHLLAGDLSRRWPLRNRGGPCPA